MCPENSTVHVQMEEARTNKYYFNIETVRTAPTMLVLVPVCVGCPLVVPGVVRWRACSAKLSSPGGRGNHGATAAADSSTRESCQSDAATAYHVSIDVPLDSAPAFTVRGTRPIIGRSLHIG